jgi:hypothetical protein
LEFLLGGTNFVKVISKYLLGIILFYNRVMFEEMIIKPIPEDASIVGMLVFVNSYRLEMKFFRC